MNDPNKTTGSPGGTPSGGSSDLVMPTQIGRYHIERVLGEGGFGLVFLATDEQLQRLVAIKVRHPELVADVTATEAYLIEARTVANLDHPHIVPVYDVGSTDQFPCFVVSKYIDGTDLAKRLKRTRLSIREAIELVATVADALHFAHKHGLVHRDVKPANVLLEKGGKPYLADFGLALPERDVGKGPRYIGSPPYMSPEQARGEGHRVDGRSDIFSLGTVLYELLTGRQPFKGDSQQDLLDQVTSFEPRPLRQWDDAITKELERICLKALAKRIPDRYTTARDFADDLRHYLANEPSNQVLTPNPSGVVPALQSSSTIGGQGSDATQGGQRSDSQLIKIVPKGLRSFDAHDADFFLELLPGPRNRDGLPDSIRFWKTRIEERDPDSTFSVGLIYGPSGCGKSSLMKAGLLPHLSPDITAIYIEATAGETESRVLNALRKRCPGLLPTLSLKGSLAALRRGDVKLPGEKLVIILDQFEQWLHAQKGDQDGELVQALRQCDGGRVQCVIMVRDDFWMGITRFLTGLEIELLQGQNCAAADLFDLDHAQKVLAALGRAFGKLPTGLHEMSKDQKEFLKQVVHGLAQDGKIICIRLALFAEMMKGKTWTLATLKEIGGTEGVGATFLEETFASPMANPKHRVYQNEAQAVLKALLPESGTDIKGHMRSHTALREVSGLADKPEHFEALLRILDSEIRLITPTDPEGKDRDETTVASSGEKHYQLTHDYLVPSLRDWLTRKQKETRRGRAELLLADRAAEWNARPEKRQLPSLWQWLNIQWLTSKRNWTTPQHRMMQHAGKYHLIRSSVIAVLFGLVVLGCYETYGIVKAQGLRDGLLKANTAEVPKILDEIPRYRRWLVPRLRDSLQQTQPDEPAHLHASLALLRTDPSQVTYLVGRLLDAEPDQVAVIRDELAPYQEQFSKTLWQVMDNPEKEKKNLDLKAERPRLRAASALATYDPKHAKWAAYSKLVVTDLVHENSVSLGHWSNALRPIKGELIQPLTKVYLNRELDAAAERSLATNLLADFVDSPSELAKLIVDADEKQFAVIYPKLKKNLKDVKPWLETQLKPAMAASDKPPESNAVDREIAGRRQANSAIILFLAGQDDHVWDLLRRNTTTATAANYLDPTARSFLIHRLPPLGADINQVLDRLEKPADPDVVRALHLCLGEFDTRHIRGVKPPATSAVTSDATPKRDWIDEDESFTEDEAATEDGRPADNIELTKEELALTTRLTNLVGTLKEVYKKESDPGLHATTEWLLRRWGHSQWLKDTKREWAQDKTWRSSRELEIRRSLVNQNSWNQWYVNGQGQTLIVIPHPKPFQMGAPASEPGRQDEIRGIDVELQHTRTIGRSFALGAKSVTVGQFLRSKPDDNELGKKYTRSNALPMVRTSWTEAAEYCNWLSQQEGIDEKQHCYEIDKNSGKLVPKADWIHLTGYRLPTEAEFEYAVRAESITSRYFGDPEELLVKYAWYQKNSKDKTWPVGRLKPNDFGFFDMEGNSFTWCQEVAVPNYLKKDERVAPQMNTFEDLIKGDRPSRVLRGTSFFNMASITRSAYRYFIAPGIEINYAGLRVARTVTPEAAQ